MYRLELTGTDYDRQQTYVDSTSYYVPCCSRLTLVSPISRTTTVPEVVNKHVGACYVWYAHFATDRLESHFPFPLFEMTVVYI